MREAIEIDLERDLGIASVTGIEKDIIFGGEKLQGIVKSLKTRFFTVEEFPHLDREFLPENVIRDALELADGSLEDYALGLTGKELESVILDLRNASAPAEIDSAVRILKTRRSSRLIRLLTILFQYHDTSVGLNTAMREMTGLIRQSGTWTREEAFSLRFGDQEHKVEAVGSAVKEEGKNINECFQAYLIDENSPFAARCALNYLSAADEEGISVNKPWVVKTIENQPEEQLRKLIENYLMICDLEQFNDGINLAILHKIGQPYISTDWEDYSAEAKKKFSRWYFLHRLKLHTLRTPKKYAILSKYAHRVRSSYMLEEENIFIMDFGDTVIADLFDRPYSFFCQKEIFDQEMAVWQEDPEKLPTFIRMDRRNLTARDYIIEELEEPCVKLSYEGIDILYIQEMLDIKMGFEPDMRKKQLAKLIPEERPVKRRSFFRKAIDTMKG